MNLLFYLIFSSLHIKRFIQIDLIIYIWGFLFFFNNGRGKFPSQFRFEIMDGENSLPSFDLSTGTLLLQGHINHSTSEFDVVEKVDLIKMSVFCSIFVQNFFFFKQTLSGEDAFPSTSRVNKRFTGMCFVAKIFCTVKPPWRVSFSSYLKKQYKSDIPSGQFSLYTCQARFLNATRLNRDNF